MKKKSLIVLTTITFAVSGIMYSFNNKEVNSIFPKSESTAVESCPKAGQPDCLIIDNCPYKGTADCPYVQVDCCAKK